MTFTDIVSGIAEELNLTTDVAVARIGRNVNKRYRQLCSSLGLDTTQTVVGVTATTTISSRSLTFGPTPTPVEKILVVYNTAFNPPFVLTEALLDDLRNQVVGTDPPEEYAILATGPNYVTIYLDCVPATQYALTADVRSNVSTMSGTMVPVITESFQDLLEYGPKAIELRKLEKANAAAEQERLYEKRLGEYRLFLAESAYLDMYQGKTSSNNQLTTPLV